MAKIFYTEWDIQDMTRQGITSLAVNDDVVLTDLALEMAMKHGIRLVRENEVYREERGDAELIARVKAAVVARLGGDVDMAQLDGIIRRAIRSMK
jgi:hypothetical protein